MSYNYSHLSFLYLTVLLMTMLSNQGIHSGPSSESSLHSIFSGGGDGNNSMIHRKLLAHRSCTSKDISISQSKESISGIPQYIVEIVNTCVFGSSCSSPSNIHLHCAWFASATIISPLTFKRLSFDDCLVNGGKPLRTSQVIRFTYSNSFMYPLSLRSAQFC